MSKLCTVEGCTNKLKSRGMCAKHYERNRLYGDVNIRFPNQQLYCTVENCYNKHVAKGLCQMHYARVYRHGDTNSLIPNYGTHKIKHEQGYIMVWNGKKYEMEHVLMAEAALGKKLPENAVVHHVNEKPWDNETPFNLVVCPDQEYHFLLHKRAKEYDKFGKCSSLERKDDPT